ncbi:MAG TPA: hypothetical protein VK509_21345 [Polyangiales bacterium]|nr:hypothetical protein [Polyangiales bacterium]
MAEPLTADELVRMRTMFKPGTLFDRLLTEHAERGERIVAWARTALSGENANTDEAHAALTELGQFASHDGECDYANGCCGKCGRWSTWQDYLDGVDAHLATLTKDERDGLDNEFIGPCVHGRDPWTRCDEGCDTEEQARGLKPPTPSVATLLARVAELERERDTPHIADFLEAVKLEALHQRERWGSEHDAGKEPQDWFWLLGYLGGKALASAARGDREKALHHTISSAAVLLNWHQAMSGADTRMRPGIEPPADQAPKDGA